MLRFSLDYEMLLRTILFATEQLSHTETVKFTEKIQNNLLNKFTFHT